MLKYVVSIIIAIAFFNGSEKTESVILTEEHGNSISEGLASYTNISVEDFNLLFTFRTSTNYTYTAQSSSNRTTNSLKNNLRFIKSGNFSDCHNPNFTPKYFTSIHFLFIKPIHRLISLGKLLI